MENLRIFKVSFNFNQSLPAETCRELRMTIRVITGYNTNFIELPFDDVFFLAFAWDSVKILAYSGNDALFEATSALSDLGSEKSFDFSIRVNCQSHSVQLKIAKVGPNKSEFKVLNEVSKCFNEILTMTEIFSQFSTTKSIEFDVKQSGLDLFFLPDLSKICLKDSEFIEGLLRGLNEKLKVLQIFDFIVKENEQQSKNHLETRLELEKVLENNSKEFRKIQETHEKTLADSNHALNTTKLLLNSQVVLIRQMENKITELLSQNKTLEETIKKLNFQVRNFEDQEKMIQNLQKNLKTSDNEREKLRENFKNFKENQTFLDRERVKELETLSNENQNLRSTLQSLQKEKFLLSDYIAKQGSDLSSKNSLIKSLKSELESYKNIESKASQMENLAKNNQEIIIKTFDQLSSNTSKFSEIVSMLNSEKLKMLRTSADLQVHISRLEQQNKLLTDKSKSESILSQEYKSSISVLIQSEIVNKDCKSITKTLVNLYSDVSKAKLKFLTDFEVLLKAFLQTSKGLLLLNRCLSKIREINLEKDLEIIVFQDILTQIQKSMPYVPIKEDEIDQALADYLNSLPFRLQVPFLREDSGIYLFGTKRVVIKLDNGKLSIRVGGGAILVDEFIQMYSDSELQKTQDRGKRKNSPSRPAAIGKILSFAVGEKPKSSDVSPQKAAKIILEMTGKNRILTTKRTETRGKAEFVSPSKRSK